MLVDSGFALVAIIVCVGIIGILGASREFKRKKENERALQEYESAMARSEDEDQRKIEQSMERYRKEDDGQRRQEIAAMRQRNASAALRPSGEEPDALQQAQGDLLLKENEALKAKLAYYIGQLPSGENAGSPEAVPQAQAEASEASIVMGVLLGYLENHPTGKRAALSKHFKEYYPEHKKEFKQCYSALLEGKRLCEYSDGGSNSSYALSAREKEIAIANHIMRTLAYEPVGKRDPMLTSIAKAALLPRKEILACYSGLVKKGYIREFTDASGSLCYRVNPEKPYTLRPLSQQVEIKV